MIYNTKTASMGLGLTGERLGGSKNKRVFDSVISVVYYLYK